MTTADRRKPNLLLIGAPRCASTSLAAALAKHPDIFVSSPKEPHFLAMHGHEREMAGIGSEAFARQNRFTLDRWSDLFVGRTERYLMDASVSTISYPETAIRNIKRYCEERTKILVILRNPVDRAFSSHQYCLSRGWAAGSVEECLDQESARIAQNWQHLWFLKSLSQYELRLRPFLDAFGADNMHIVITEEFSRDSALVLSGIFKALDLPSIPIDEAPRYNSGGVPKSRLLGELTTFVRARPVLLKALCSVSTMSFRDRIKARSLQRTTMTNGTRERLSHDLAETRPWVEQLIGRPLDSWN